MSSLGAGLGILCHSAAATFGLALLIQTSAAAFWVVKLVGAAYLVWLGAKALLSRDLITFAPTARRPLNTIFLSGVVSNVLNPKIGLFVLAFIPQFVNAQRGPVSDQMLIYGAWLALVAAIGLSMVGCFASGLSAWLLGRPRVIAGINVGAGLTFIASGLSAVALKHR